MHRPLNAKLILMRQWLPYLVKIGSSAFRRKVIELAPFEAPRELVHIKDVMKNCAADILRKKKEDLEEGVAGNEAGQGKDVMTCLCEWSPHSPSANKKLNDSLPR